MSPVMPFETKKPELGRDCFVAPNATVIGDVALADEANVWYGSVLRGDIEAIRVGARTNIQDNAVVHTSTGVCPAVIGADCTVGHAAIVHGAQVADRVLVGMGAILLDEAEIGSDTIIGAGALVTVRTKIPSGVMVIGKPAKVVRELKPGEVEMIRWSAAHYVELAKRHVAALASGDR